MRINKNSILSNILLASTLILSSGCFDASGTQDLDSLDMTSDEFTTYFKISGVATGSGYAKNSIDRFFRSIITPAYAVGLDSPDTVVVVYNHGEDYHEFEIKPDGSFEIDTSYLRQNDLVALIVNKITKKIFGHLNLSTNSSDSLDYIDKSSMKDDLSLGNVDTENNCKSSTTLDGTIAFKADEIDSLKKISRFDDSLSLYANNWKNPDIQSYIGIKFNLGKPSAINGSFNTITEDIKTNYFLGTYPIFYLKGGIANNTSSIALYPPSEVHVVCLDAGNSYFCTNPNGYTKTANSTTPIIKTNLPSPITTETGSLRTVGTTLVDSLPIGDWILKNNDTDTSIGVFEFADAKPFDNKNKFLGIIPKVKITTDNNGILQYVTVKLYTQSADGSLVQITKKEFKKLTDEIIFSYVLSNGDGKSVNLEIDINNSTQSEITYKVSADIKTSDINRLIYGYIIGQSKYQFFFE